jgi:hypothetical protein
MRQRAEPGYRNQTAGGAQPKPKPQFVPVVCPRPVFGSVTEKLMYEYAVESTPREKGEGLLEWVARVAAAAQAQARRAEKVDSGKTEGA